MTFLLLVLLLVVVGVAATVSALLHDDRGYLPPPESHQVDPDFLPPSAPLTRR